MKKMLALAGLAGILALTGAAAFAQTEATWGTACTWIALDDAGLAAGVVDFRLNQDGTLDRTYYDNGGTPNDADGKPDLLAAEYRSEPADYIKPFATNLRNAQKAVLTVPLEADIPCCLKMKFKGNSINAMLGSVGPNQTAQINAGNLPGTDSYFSIDFKPALGGLVDGEWNFLEGSQDPNCDTKLYCKDNYIRACDTYEVELWSNLAYKYSVKAANGGYLVGAVPTGTDNLELDMRTHFEQSPSAITTTWASGGGFPGLWSDLGYASFDLAPGAEIPVLTGAAMEYAKVWHQFRVPMNTVPAGRYKGKLTFTAMTI